MNTYSVYGVVVQTDRRFVTPLTQSTERPDVTIVDRPPDALPMLDGLPLVFESEAVGADDRRFRIYDAGDAEILCMFGIADYVVGDHRIECVLHDADLDYLVEIHLLGTVLAYWLERRGLLALHASAVVVDGGAVGFVGGKQAGKTTLAASLVRSGLQFLTDDLLAIEQTVTGPVAHPAFPQFRMWPGDAEHFVGGSDRLERAHPLLDKRRVPLRDLRPDAFAAEPAPLRALYVTSRSDAAGSEVSIEALPSAGGVREVLSASFTGTIAGVTGGSAQRLRRVAGLVAAVPVRRLIYPRSRERLGEVVEAIRGDRFILR